MCIYQIKVELSVYLSVLQANKTPQIEEKKHNIMQFRYPLNGTCYLQWLLFSMNTYLFIIILVNNTSCSAGHAASPPSRPRGSCPESQV